MEFASRQSMFQRARPWLVVIGGILVHLSLGTLYTFGNMTPYFTSYIRAYSSPKSVTYFSSTWVFALQAAGQGGAMFLGGILNAKIGPRLTTLLGGWLMSLGIFLTFFTIKYSFYACLVTYGLMFGLGVGLAYAVPLACGMKWLPKKKGLVNGMVLAGFGGGAFIFNQVQTAFINPDNKTPDQPLEPGSSEMYFSKENAQDVLDRVPYCFLLLGGCYATLQLIGACLLSTPPEEPQPDSDEAKLLQDEETDVELIDTSEPENPSLSPKEVLKSKAFYVLWITFLVNGQGTIFISTLYKAYGQTFIKDDYFLSLVGAFASVCNALGRIMWGAIADRYSYRLTMMMLCSVMVSLTLTIIISPLGGKAFYFIWVCLIFLTFSGNFALFPTAIAKSFGTKHVAVNFGLLFSSQVVTAIIGSLLTTLLSNAIGWTGIFFLAAGFTFIGLVTTYFFNVKQPNGIDDV